MEPEFVFASSPNAAEVQQKNPLSERLLGSETAHDAEHGSLIVDDNHQSGSISNSGVVGEKQPNQYRDVWAAFLFVAVQCVLLYFSFFWGISAFDKWMSSGGSNKGNNLAEDHDHNDNGTSYVGTVWLVMICTLAAFVIAGGVMSVLLRVAQQLIQISLMATVASLAALSIFFLTQGLWWAMLASLVFVAIAVIYAMSVWRRIPLAAANLQVAITAIQANGGLVATAVGVTVLVNGIWTLLWGLAWIGVYAHSLDCTAVTATAAADGDADHDHECVSRMNPLAMIALLLVYSWTIEVANNVLHVTTAGVVGTFWFAPNDCGTYCSPAVTDSFVRSMTFSFGSICFGSLLTSVVQGVHAIVASLKQAQTGRVSSEIVLCVLECITAFLERIVVYFNTWAFCYIGLYGYEYLTAGKKVTALLMDRGWTAVINDNLVVRVLMLVSLVIGAATGVVGLLLVDVRPLWVGEWGARSGMVVAFIVPALIGTTIAHILMSVVKSAVDTVVVCFAEAPLEFARGHPGLSTQLVAAWRLVYPDEYMR